VFAVDAELYVIQHVFECNSPQRACVTEDALTVTVPFDTRNDVEEVIIRDVSKVLLAGKVGVKDTWGFPSDKAGLPMVGVEVGLDSVYLL
jgi:nitrogen fixation protein